MGGQTAGGVGDGVEPVVVQRALVHTAGLQERSDLLTLERRESNGGQGGDPD